ncbi:ABC transporter permease [Breznakiella homolactica]|uniref:ABC transporter permease n=1 Tax=Breznakiella homolactica TaxID=2798577 RepID=A0A7T7XL75_9SPIR|nr:ABC transporter permease [Breznakiella homolactica]QQO08444.1 ABC transporter permease [Breznakiella homolactica]
MLRYIVLRILKGVVTFLAAVTITFLIIRLLPGDPTTAFISDSLTPEDAEAIKVSFGLDKPIHTQYFLFLKNLLKLDLGYSFFYKDTVVSILGNRLWWTMLLMVSSLGLTLLIGIPLGVYAAKHKGKFLDQLINVLVTIGISIFVPLLAFALLYLFSYKLRLTPVGGAYTPGGSSFFVLDVLKHLILPCATLVILYLASIVLYTRNSMLDVLKEDYIRTARAKGVNDRLTTWGHALRNAMIPTVTVTGLMLGKMVAGAVLTETVFSWPGVGTMIYDAVQKQDYPLLQGAFLLLAFSVIVMTLITDLIVAWLDPRIKLQ